MKLACVADDITGAHDLAGRLAGVLGPVWVGLGLELPSQPAAAVVLSAETRLISPSAALAATGRAWRWLLSRHGAHLRFQKLDSTLRGNPGEDVQALLSVTGGRWAAVVPAYPRAGRTTRGGQQFVFGERLDKSEYWRDPLSPARTLRPAKLFPTHLGAHAPISVVARGSAALKRWLGARLKKGLRFATFDCVDEAHLRTIARVSLSLGCRDFAGASGLAAYLLSGTAARAALPPRRLPWIFLVGSLSATSQAQTDAWSGAGLAIASLDPVAVDQVRWRFAPAQAATLKTSLRQDRALVIRSIGRRAQLTGRTQPRSGSGEQRSDRVLLSLAENALEISGGPNRSAWFLTGGHTLATFFRRAGLSGTWIFGELVQGVPYGQASGPGAKRVWVASKPGGFGSESTLLDLVARAQGRSGAVSWQR